MAGASGFPKSILIADLDQDSSKVLASVLRKLDVHTESVQSATIAFQKLEQKLPDFLIVDWRLPDLTGLQIINRVRQRPGMLLLPMLVMSQKVRPADFRLLEEYPLTRLLTKPFDGGQALQAIRDVWEEKNWYNIHSDRLNQALRELSSGSEHAVEVFKELVTTAPFKMPLALLGARILREQGQLSWAESLAQKVVEADPNSILALNELGKIYHLSGLHSLAIKMFANAATLSPDNVERLCLLGENELKIRDYRSADKHFEQALKIDHEQPKALAGRLVISNIEEYFKTCDPQATAPLSFASLCNTIGITMVRAGRFEEGMKQYESAMVFAGNNHDSARVAYNLGLGYVRWNKPQEARDWFLKSFEISGNLFTKAKELAMRVDRIMAYQASTDRSPTRAATPDLLDVTETTTPSNKPASSSDIVFYDDEAFLDEFSDGKG
jgi:CheY-like chemotaxis protein/Tfp pilus assembly protein PilF